jgi:hypothetical protein
LAKLDCQSALTNNVPDRKKEPCNWRAPHFVFKCAPPGANVTPWGNLKILHNIACFCIVGAHGEIPTKHIHHHCQNLSTPMIVTGERYEFIRFSGLTLIQSTQTSMHNTPITSHERGRVKKIHRSVCFHLGLSLGRFDRDRVLKAAWLASHVARHSQGRPQTIADVWG